MRPITRHGQNFLIDLNLVDLVVESSDLSARDVVLEVGTGTGSLTARLSAKAGAVVSVEIDPNLHQLAREQLAGASNATLLLQDALKNKNTLHPEVLDAVAAALRAVPDGRFKLAANLPYCVATPVISNLLSAPVVPERMVVTIQKELADRMTASPGTKDYGAISVWMQSQCGIERIRELPPDVFWPRPKVGSAIVRILPDPVMRAALGDAAYFHAFTRAVFLHRRKLLRGGLAAALSGRFDKPSIDAILATHDLPRDARAEQLAWPRVHALAESFRRAETGGRRAAPR
ncbi:MAG: ribosomal RNA small subunit methyltransferase A [Planctomycetes bacterium]|nr:ribosomal RNA small subunit methyltransferase A [Planctomycetota bacterium]